MSGHSRWAKIKRQKAGADKKKGQAFSKLSKAVTVAAKAGGDPASNASLRLEIERAKNAGMTLDTIGRAVKKGTGEDKESAAIEEITYEAYGPGGVGLLIKTATDNRNRTSSSMKHLLNRHGGSLGAPGSVSYLFESKGQILVPKEDNQKLEELSLEAIDLGAEDVTPSEEGLEIYTQPNQLESIKKGLEKKGALLASFEIIMKPQTILDPPEAQKAELEKLVEVLEEDEDVISVDTNAQL